MLRRLRLDLCWFLGSDGHLGLEHFEDLRGGQDNLGIALQLLGGTPAMIAQDHDSRSAKTRANRKIALLSHVFNTAREWGLTTRDNPCLGVRKAASEINDLSEASVLLGRSKEGITKRVYRRVGEVVSPTK